MNIDRVTDTYVQMYVGAETNRYYYMDTYRDEKFGRFLLKF